MRMAFLAARPMSMTKSDLGVEIVLHPSGEQPGERAENGDRRREQHAEGERPALILGRENQKDKEQREAEDGGRAARPARPSAPERTFPDNRSPCRSASSSSENLLERLHRLAQCCSPEQPLR